MAGAEPEQVAGAEPEQVAGAEPGQVAEAEPGQVAEVEPEQVAEAEPVAPPTDANNPELQVAAEPDTAPQVDSTAAADE